MFVNTTARFEAAHRQFNDPGKCGLLHGHNWKVDIAISGNEVNDLGYLVNFSDVKRVVNQYDHAVILNELDPMCIVLEANNQKVCRIPVNPTCENLAKILKTAILELLMDQYVIPDAITITVWENDESMACEMWIKGDFNESK